MVGIFVPGKKFRAEPGNVPEGKPRQAHIVEKENGIPSQQEE